MSMASRLAKLEGSQPAVRTRKWFWDSLPDRLEIDGAAFDRLSGETDDASLDRVTQELPQAEITIFGWLPD
ncbi:MAG: hypothetical protein NTV17_09275 [Burkholderiales bacterium]|nr:hypothetical protein [Burkholderiales bacterium]